MTVRVIVVGDEAKGQGTPAPVQPGGCAVHGAAPPAVPAARCSCPHAAPVYACCPCCGRALGSAGCGCVPVPVVPAPAPSAPAPQDAIRIEISVPPRPALPPPAPPPPAPSVGTGFGLGSDGTPRRVEVIVVSGTAKKDGAKSG